MEITAEKLKNGDDYTVYVGNHRILTISTYCNITASKWLSEVHKTNSNNKHGTLVVGICAERENCKFEKGGLKESHYDLLKLCIGSHCLLYHFPDPQYNGVPKCFKTFFADPQVIAVGMDMVSLAKNLEIHHQIKIANPMDLNDMAVKGMTKEYNNVDLGRYNLDQLAEAVLENHVKGSKYQVEWYPKCDRFPWFEIHNPFTLPKVKYATLDPYLCFLIGSKFLDQINGAKSTSTSKKKKKKMMNKRINEGTN